MKKYTNIDLATTTRMHKEALDYYMQIFQDFKNENHTRPLGIRSTCFLTAYSELLYKISQLNKYYPGCGHNDIVAHIHFKMSFHNVSRLKFNHHDDFYYWDLRDEVQAPVKIETIDYVIEEKRKNFFVLLSSGHQIFDSTPCAYRPFENNEREEYLNTPLKGIPKDWKLELKRGEEKSNSIGLYLPIDRKPSKTSTPKNEVAELPGNVTKKKTMPEYLRETIRRIKLLRKLQQRAAETRE